MGLIPGLGKSPGGGHSNALQYSCLENPMDIQAWQVTGPGVPKSCTWLKQLSMHTKMNQFSLVTQSCPTLCDPMNRNTPGLPVHHQLPEFIQTHVHWSGDAIQPSHAWLSHSPPVFNLSQHQGLFKWVSSSHQVAKLLKFKLQHQSFY